MEKLTEEELLKFEKLSVGFKELAREVMARRDYEGLPLKPTDKNDPLNRLIRTLDIIGEVKKANDNLNQPAT